MRPFQFLFQWFAFLGVFGLHLSSSKSASSSATTNNNIDKRQAVEGGAALNDSSGNSIEINSTDAVKAIAGMGADVIRSSGAAVVDLSRAGMDSNLKAWDATVSSGAALIDKLIDASTSVGTAAVASFQPAENKASESTTKIAMFAAAAVAATLLLRKA